MLSVSLWVDLCITNITCNRDITQYETRKDDLVLSSFIFTICGFFLLWIPWCSLATSTVHPFYQFARCEACPPHIVTRLPSLLVVPQWISVWVVNVSCLTRPGIRHSLTWVLVYDAQLERGVSSVSFIRPNCYWYRILKRRKLSIVRHAVLWSTSVSQLTLSCPIHSSAKRVNMELRSKQNVVY